MLTSEEAARTQMASEKTTRGGMRRERSRSISPTMPFPGPEDVPMQEVPQEPFVVPPEAETLDAIQECRWS